MANPLIELQERAALGDPEALAAIQRFNTMGNGGPPPGAMPPPQGAMTQSQFGNGRPVPPDVKARQAEQLIKLLRARGG